jgi:hypothetical protein
LKRLRTPGAPVRGDSQATACKGLGGRPGPAKRRQETFMNNPIQPAASVAERWTPSAPSHGEQWPALQPRAGSAQAWGALALGALAFGALALGALAIGRLAIGGLAIRRSHIRRLRIDDLDVKRLRVERFDLVQ